MAASTASATELARARQRQHEPQARERAEQVRAGVAEHRALAQVVGAGDERRRGEQPERPQRPHLRRADRQPGPEQHERLGRAPRAQIEQVEDVGGQHEHRRRQQPAPVGEAQVAHREQRQTERSGGLQRAGGELAPQRRGAVTAPAALERARRSSPALPRGRACRRSGLGPARRTRTGRSAAASGSNTRRDASRASSISGISASVAAAGVSTPNGNGSGRRAVVGLRVPSALQRAEQRPGPGSRRTPARRRKAGRAWMEANGGGGRAQGGSLRRP